MNGTNSLDNYKFRPIFEEIQLAQAEYLTHYLSTCVQTTEGGTWKLMDYQKLDYTWKQELGSVRRKWKGMSWNVFIHLSDNHGNV